MINTRGLGLNSNRRCQCAARFTDNTLHRNLLLEKSGNEIITFEYSQIVATDSNRKGS